MNKQWIDSTDGKELILELSSQPEIRNYIKEQGFKHIVFMEQNLLRMNLANEDSDRKFVIQKSEIDGARAMLGALLAPLEQQPKERGTSNARERKQ